MEIVFVAFCAPRPQAPSHGRFVHEMACALQKAGHAVTVFVPVRVFPDVRLLKTLCRPFYFGRLLTAWRAWRNLWVGAKGVVVYDDVRYVYFRFTTLPPTNRRARNGEAVASRIHRWLPMLQQQIAGQPDAVCGHFLDTVPLIHTIAQRIGGRRLLYVHESPYGLSPALQSADLKADVATLDCMLSTSRYNLGLLQEIGFLPESVAVAPPTCASHLACVEYEPPAPEPVFSLVYVARFTVNKAHDAIVRAVGAWNEQGRHPELRVTFLGDQGAMRSRVKQQIAESACREAFSMRTYGNAGDLADALCRANAFISPSRYESFGVALLEAACMGLPLLTTMRSGFVQTVCDAGYAVVPMDADSIAGVLDGIERLVRDYEGVLRNARQLRAYVLNTFTAGRFADAFVAAATEAGGPGKEADTHA